MQNYSQEFCIFTGIILKTAPIGDYDRRICLLTKERGKISAFARGARRPTNKMAAAVNPFSFGAFKLREGADSYNLIEADISNYFEGFRTDYEKACYAAYFAEVTDFYTRENNDEVNMLKLIYSALLSLLKLPIPLRLIKSIFELKVICINGEYPGIPTDIPVSATVKYAMDFIMNTPIEKVFSFNLTEEAVSELEKISEKYIKNATGHSFKSLEILKTL